MRMMESESRIACVGAVKLPPASFVPEYSGPKDFGIENSGMKILVGDDQVDVLEAIRLLLKGAGHQSETAESPRAVLAAAEKNSFDLILMDMNYSRDTTSGDE